MMAETQRTLTQDELDERANRRKFVRWTPIDRDEVNFDQFLAPDSRYAGLRLLADKKLGVVTFEQYDPHVLAKIETDSDEFFLVTTREQYRPDKIADAMYGNPDLWWLIMEANGIFDIEDITAGRTLRIPPEFTSRR